MGFGEFLASIGLGGLVAEDFFVAQVGLLAATIILFFFCLALSVISFRAAGSARRARMDAAAHFQSAQELAIEVRHLTAQVENAATRQNAAASKSELRLEGGSVPNSPVRVGAREETPEAEIDFVQDDHAQLDQSRNDDAGEDSGKRQPTALDAAKEAASVPSSLLGGLMRRRR